MSAVEGGPLSRVPLHMSIHKNSPVYIQGNMNIRVSMHEYTHLYTGILIKYTW